MFWFRLHEAVKDHAYTHLKLNTLVCTIHKISCCLSVWGWKTRTLHLKMFCSIQIPIALLLHITCKNHWLHIQFHNYYVHVLRTVRVCTGSHHKTKITCTMLVTKLQHCRLTATPAILVLTCKDKTKTEQRLGSYPDKGGAWSSRFAQGNVCVKDAICSLKVVIRFLRGWWRWWEDSTCGFEHREKVTWQTHGMYKGDREAHAQRRRRKIERERAWKTILFGAIVCVFMHVLWLLEWCDAYS